MKPWRSIQKGFGPVCEKKYLNDVYKNQQLTMDTILQKKGENMDNNDIKAKITIIDDEKKEEITLPINLIVNCYSMLIEDAIKSS